MKKLNHLQFIIASIMLISFSTKAQTNPDIDCPAPETFLVGEYQVVDVNATAGPDLGSSNFDPGIVTITGNDNTRTFKNSIIDALNFNNRDETINLILNCGVIQIEDVVPSFSCDGIANSYVLTTTDVAGSTTYILTDDDTSFVINYIEDPQGSCGGPFTSSFSLTKTCSQPQNISFSNATATSVDLNWLDTNDTSNTTSTYTIEYGLQGFALGTGQIITGITGNTTTADNIVPSTAYDFYIFGSCSDGGTSILSGPFEYGFFANPDFEVAPNGLTCLCPDANFGDVGTLSINGELKTFTKRTRQQLGIIIIEDINDPQISLTCTSAINDMSNLFQSQSNFNQNLENWDVSQVFDMSYMFRNASLFNHPVNSWDVSQVFDMSFMFWRATSFNQPLSNWDVGQVNEMSRMFNTASSFNQPLDSWNVSNVENMSYMFNFAVLFNQPLNGWSVSNVSNMAHMFAGTSFNKPLDNWDVSQVTNIKAMFLVTPFNHPLNTWDISSVTSMERTFFYAASFNQPLDTWSVGQVTNMFEMFRGAVDFNQDISGWNFNQNVILNDFLSNSGLAPSNYDALLQSYDNQNLLNLTMGADSLGYCDEITRDALINNKGWVITGDIEGQCDAALNPSTTPFVTTWQIASNDLTLEVFTIKAYDYDFSIDWGDGSLDTNVTDDIAHSYISPGTYTVSITGVFPYFKTCEITTGFTDPSCTNSEKLLNVSSWGNQEWRNMIGSFADASSFELNTTEAPDLTNVKRMNETFRNANEFNQDINNWDVSSITSMVATFQRTWSFNQPLGNWDVGNVKNMTNMFLHAASFDQSLTTWDVSSVTNMSSMFQNARNFNQPVNDWDVGNVSNMSSMFHDASAFNQSVNDWDVSNVTEMTSMFRDEIFFSSAFNQPLNDWDTSNVTEMTNMFRRASSFNQTLNNWDTSNVTNMDRMFADATLFNQDISDWCVEQIPLLPVDFAFFSALQSDFFPNWGSECENFSINENNFPTFKIYPNPVQNQLFLSGADAFGNEKVEINIYSIRGKVLSNERFSQLPNHIDVSTLASGVYLLKLTSGNQSTVRRLIKK